MAWIDDKMRVERRTHINTYETCRLESDGQPGVVGRKLSRGPADFPGVDHQVINVLEVDYKV